MSTVSTTSKTATVTKAATPTAAKPTAASTTGKPAPASTFSSRKEEESDSDDDDEDDDQKPKAFKDMKPAERQRQVEEEAKARRTNAIFRIVNKQYREEATARGAINISKTNGHFYQFRGTMTSDDYLEAWVKYGLALTVEFVEAYDEDRRLARLASDMQKAGHILAKRGASTLSPLMQRNEQYLRLPPGSANNTQGQNTSGGQKTKAKRGTRNRGRGGRARTGRA